MSLASRSTRTEPDDRPSLLSSPSILSATFSGFQQKDNRYSRLGPDQEEDTSDAGPIYTNLTELPENDSIHGLQIRFSEHDHEALSFGAKSQSSPDYDEHVETIQAPSSAKSSKHGRFASTGNVQHDDASSLASTTPSSTYRLNGPFSPDLEEELLLRPERPASTLQSFDTSRKMTSAVPIPEWRNKSRWSVANESALGLPQAEPRCKTRRHFHHSRGNWLSVTILALSVYSTIFSGIWLAIAIARPRYGRYVTDGGKLPPATASLLCAAFAKTIELSFVTVFVTFLGQVLSQRAFAKQSKGVSISEMQMRSWVMQPGTMITHWETVRGAATTVLGPIALVTAFAAMIYTTASDGLVAPKLKFGRLEHRSLYGSVVTRFGFEAYIESNCKTPITNATDPNNYGQTCMALEYSGQSYRGYTQWLTKWHETFGSSPAKHSGSERTPPLGMYDNTTVEGSWIEVQNMSEISRHYGRIINNVTTAMPLTAVLAAAQHPINDILQPLDLDGLGQYELVASVPAPATNVLCASVTKSELTPMVLTLWKDYNGTIPNNTNYPAWWDIPRYPSWLNETAVDDVFGFGKKYGRRMPIFPKLPLAYNTVLNSTAVTDTLTTDSIYILAANETSNYTLCSLRTYLSPSCSTNYFASASGGKLSTQCEDPYNEMAYQKSHPKATSGVYNSDWINVANQWAVATSLGAGISDNYASNARLLTQLAPTQQSLPPTMPSIAEALAVLASPSLLLGGVDAPFIHYWNYSASKRQLDEPQFQAFKATLRSQDYSSGGTQKWQGVFYVILTLVFFTNLFCLVYFFAHKGLVTDFIEPQNLFALAVNSPHSHVLEGSCGAGPEREQLKTNWHIRLDPGRDHFYIESLDEPPDVQVLRRRRFTPSASSLGRRIRGRSSRDACSVYSRPSAVSFEPMQTEASPVAVAFDKFSAKRGSLL